MTRFFGFTVLTVLIFLNSNKFIDAQNPFCQAYQANVLPDDLPILPNTFDVRVQANFVSKNYTVDSFQIYDGFRRRGAVQMYLKNSEFRYIFNYATNEVYCMERLVGDPRDPFYCITKTLVDADETSLFFGYHLVNSTYVIPFTPYEVLHFPKENQFYNGTETARGIPCDVYLSCQYSEPLKANFRVKFYFSKKNYTMPYLIQPYNQVPVRAELEGIYFQNNVQYPFKTVYDFHEFNPIIGEYTASFLETPVGTFCKDRKATKPIPKMSERYAFSEEIINWQSIINFKRIYYDSLFKLVRYDVRNTQRVEETLFVLDPLVVINDFSLGVGYYRNKFFGNCTFKSIGSGTFGVDNDANFTQQSLNQGFGVAVRLKTPTSFLYLDSDYIFMGERFDENQLPVDLFISNRSDVIQGQLEEAFYEYTFRMEFTNGNGPVNTARRIPVRMKIITPDPQQSPRFNYFNFERDFPDYSIFDISSCFNTEDKVNFRVSFSYRDIVSANDFKNTFVQFMEQFLYYVLTVELNETAMRFAPPKITVGNDGFFYAVSSILPPMPPLTLFTKYEGKWLFAEGATPPVTASSGEDCAKLCNDQTECLSFDYCTNGASCYLHKKRKSDEGSYLADSANCTHYSRTAETQVKVKPTSIIWTLLQNSVALGLFRLELPIATAQGFKNVNFTANGVSQINENNQFGASSLLSRFDLQFTDRKYLTQKERYYVGVSVDECASSCTREDRFICESFDYCWVSGECRLSRFQPTDLTDITPAQSCNIYQKDALYHYDQFPLSVNVNSNDVKVDNINTAADCAKQCDSATKVHCRGFNFCESTKTCYLTETHLLDESTTTNLDLVCVHYSRSYIKDFTYTSTANISTSKAEIVYSESGLDLCSRACVGADGFNCKSFDYCPRSRKCLLHSSNRTQEPAGPNDINVESCDNYIRDYYFLTSTNVNVKYPKVSDNSESILIGLSITFSILSIVGGLLIFIFLLPKFSK